MDAGPGGLVVAAVFCERVSMIAFARVQVRLLRAGGQRLNLMSAPGIVFAGNALSIRGAGLAIPFRDLLVCSGHFLRPRVTASPSTPKTLRLACRSRENVSQHC